MRRIGRIVVISLSVAGLSASSFALPHPPKPGKVHRKAHRAARRHAKKTRIRVRVAPPVPRVVVRTPAPSTRHVYVAGYWHWDPVKVTHVWVDPVWKLPPAEGKVWHPGHWEKDGDEWEWEEGEWETREEHMEHLDEEAEEAGPPAN